MTFAEIITAIKAGVEDTGGNLYPDAELLSATNEAVQYVLSSVRENDPQFKMTGKTSVAFTSSETEHALPSDIKGITYAEDDLNNKINIVNLARKDDPVYVAEKYMYLDSSGVWQLGRRVSGSAETINVWYTAKITDETSVSSTTDLSYLPSTGERWIQSYAELLLLSNRNRRNRLKEIREAKLRDLVLNSNLRNSSEPEMVSYVET